MTSPKVLSTFHSTNYCPSNCYRRVHYFQAHPIQLIFAIKLNALLKLPKDLEP